MSAAMYEDYVRSLEHIKLFKAIATLATDANTFSISAIAQLQ